MLGCAGSPHHQSTIGNDSANGLEFFRRFEQIRGAHRGASLAKSIRIRIHET